MAYFPTEYGFILWTNRPLKEFLLRKHFESNEKSWTVLAELYFHSLFISNFVFYFAARVFVSTTQHLSLSPLMLSLSLVAFIAWKYQHEKLIVCPLWHLWTIQFSVCAHHSLFTHMYMCVERRYPLNWYGDCFGVRNFEQQMNIHSKKGTPAEWPEHETERANEWTKTTRSTKQ